jgi:hypothetical protein
MAWSRFSSALLVALPAAFALGSTACGRSSDSAARQGESAPAAGAAASAGAGPVNTEIELEVSGGPHAGRHAAKVKEATCSYGLAGEGSWGNAYTVDTDDPKKFSSLQLVVPDSKAAAGGTKQFQLTAMFGPLATATSYDVSEGSVRVDDRGSSGTVTFDGKTKSGVGLKGTIKCNSVVTPTGLR